MSNLSDLFEANPQLVYYQRNDTIRDKILTKPVTMQVFGRLIYVKVLDLDSIYVSRLDYKYDEENHKVIVYLDLDSIKIPIDIRFSNEPSITLKKIRKEYRQQLPEVDGAQISFYPNDLI